jgi:predicted MFS family arabinose efflux permease
MRVTLAIISFMTFASALSVRAVDPMIPQIAHDFWLPPATAAMLAAAFISYGMVLPVLGPVADSVGKKRVMIGCLFVLTVAAFLCAVATTFQQLFILRVIAGAGCGGLFPIGMAMLSNLVPVAQRQVAIGRLLAGTITGNLMGSAAAGVVADLIHWRGVFLVLGVISLIALVLAIIGLRGLPEAPRQPLDPRTVILRYRAIFRIPTARICYLTVLSEGIFLMGLFAYVAVMLLEAGETRASIAGLVIASFAVGGIIYTVSIGVLLRLLGQRWVMIVGGLFMATGIAALAFTPPWQVQCVLFAMMGLGFYMLHASIQVFVTELAPATRSSAIAFHTFSIFVGQSIGTAAFGYGLTLIGSAATLAICSAAIALTGLISAHLLTRPKAPV